MMRWLILAGVITAGSGAWAGSDDDDGSKPPSVAQVMKEDLLRAKIKYSKVRDGKRATITIQSGTAERVDPQWAEGPAPLKFDLDKNRQLAATIKSAKLGPTKKKPSESPDDRTLEIQWDTRTGYQTVGIWSMKLKKWKTVAPKLVEQLEPLFEAQTEIYKKVEPPK